MTTRWRLLLAAVAISSITGCFKREYTPELDIDKAELVTPDRSYPLGLKKIRSCWWPVVFTGGPEDLKIRFSALPDCEALDIASLRLETNPQTGHTTRWVVGRTDVTILAEKSFYQLNDEEPTLLAIESRLLQTNNSTIEYLSHRITAPEALGKYRMGMHGGSLPPSTVHHVREGRRNWHRFYLAFTVDGRPHHLEIVYRLQLDTSWTIGVPGMP